MFFNTDCKSASVNPMFLYLARSLAVNFNSPKACLANLSNELIVANLLDNVSIIWNPEKSEVILLATSNVFSILPTDVVTPAKSSVLLITESTNLFDPVPETNVSISSRNSFFNFPVFALDKIVLNSGMYLTNDLTPAFAITFASSGICANPIWLNMFA